jgi:hypothetical protein
MTTDIENAASTVLELTNKAGAAAVDIQQTTQAARSARQTAAMAARHPGRLAALGCGLLFAAGILALRRERADAARLPADPAGRRPGARAAAVH